MKTQALALAAATVALSLMTGCATSSPTGSPTAMAPTTQPATAEQVSKVDFWYALARKGAVTNDEATRGILLHLDDPMAAGTYAERASYMKSKGLLPRGFDAPATARATRGDLAVGFCKILNLNGGVNQMLLGPTPRYCTRTLVFEGFYPDSTENQAFTGAEFVGIVGAADDRRRGDPSNYPAEIIPGYTEQEPKVAAGKLAPDGSPVLPYRELPLILTEPVTDYPVYLQAATAPTEGKLRVFITAVQGEQAQYRKDANSPWEDAEEGIELTESAEFRTGDKSSIRFNIPPGQTFTLDRLGSCTIAQAVQLGNTVKTQVAVEQGRLRMDVNEIAPAIKAKLEKIDANTARIAEAGVIHETSIRSPNSALAVRGTKVSLFDQPPYAPRAISLTGRAEYINTRRQAVAFGGVGARNQVEGAETGAAQNAAIAAAPRLPSAVLAAGFDVAQQNRVLATGGFIRGDVVVGNAGVDVSQAFANAPLAFVLSFGAPGNNSFQDLNLAVISPNSTAGKPDFVANGPFTGSLNPNRPGYDEYRATFYPKTSPSGGTISKNSVIVPESFAVNRSEGTTSFRGTEFAVFGADAPKGVYRIAVTNFIDVPDGVDAPGKGSNPVPATVQVVVNGKSFTLGQQNFPVGLYETVVLAFDTNSIPQDAFTAVPNAGKKLSKSQLAAQQRAANRAANKALKQAQAANKASKK